MRYLTRWKIKFNKNINIYYLVKYIFNDLLNIFFTKILVNKVGIELKKKDRVLFIEPKKQGFGDLLFQTTIFELLGENCMLDLLCKEEHLPIVFNNPYLNRVFIDKNINYKKYNYVIFLSRSTLYENVLAQKCILAKKISLDKDLQLWTDTFSKNWWPVAWQILLRSKISLPFLKSYLKPKLYYENHKKSNIILLVIGVEREDKGLVGQENIIDFIYKTIDHTRWKLKIIGTSRIDVDLKKYKNIINLVNKTTYEECIKEITKSKVLIGPEGSLAHISIALNNATLIQNSERLSLIEKSHSEDFYIFSNAHKERLEDILPKVLKRLND